MAAVPVPVRSSYSHHAVAFPTSLCCAIALSTGLAYAREVKAEAITETSPDMTCSQVLDDQLRLQCYDALFGRPHLSQENIAEQTQNHLQAEEMVTTLDDDEQSEVRKHMEREDLLFGHTFAITPHRKTYLLPYTYVHKPNQFPYRDLDTSVTDDQQLQHQEVKFQISLKVPLIDDFLLQDSTLWFGYTQVSLWQAYNSEASAPFRETNYEPEIFWSIPTDLSIGNTDIAQLNLGLVHQSNGRSDPLSRSWNRAYAEVVLAHNRWAFAFKPWYRIPDASDKDDNPDIEKYLGYADFQAAYKWGENFLLTTTLRNNFRSEDNHTSVTIGLGFPLPGRLNGFIEYVDGYGETLIDYNYRNQRIGIGFILNDWY